MQIQNNDGLSKFEKAACVGASLYGTKEALQYSAPKIQTTVANYFAKLPQPTKAQSDVLIKSMQKAPELVKAKLKMFFIDEKNIADIGEKMMKASTESFAKIFSKTNNFGKQLSYMNNLAIQSFLKQTAEGKNAFYLYNCEMVAAPKSNPALILHEMGHAINANKFKWAKPLTVLMKTPLISIAMLTIPTIAVWKACGKKDEKSFIKDNAGKLAFTAFIPTIAEEAIASAHAIKNSIKCKMPQNIIKNQVKSLSAAFSSYVGIAAIAGLATAGFVKLAGLYRDIRKN